jgi:RimJ/RimL family protein N-acetyltransferase
MQMVDYDFSRFIRDPEPWVIAKPLPGPIVTERLEVRRWQSGDGPKLFDAIQCDRAALLPWMVWALRDHRTLDESIHYVERQLRRAADPASRDFNVGFFERATGQCVGGGGWARIEPNLREAEIGYWVAGSRQRRGYCSEAVRGMITQGFAAIEQGGWAFRRIHILCLSENVGSRRVCEKLGLRLELRAKQARYLGGEDGGRYHDLLGYAVLADEWDLAAQCLKALVKAAAGIDRERAAR